VKWEGRHDESVRGFLVCYAIAWEHWYEVNGKKRTHEDVVEFHQTACRPSSWHVVPARHVGIDYIADRRGSFTTTATPQVTPSYISVHVSMLGSLCYDAISVYEMVNIVAVRPASRPVFLSVNIGR
jgi:hypothetical protein